MVFDIHAFPHKPCKGSPHMMVVRAFSVLIKIKEHIFIKRRSNALLEVNGKLTLS
jgi:hypothetical protein